MSRDKRERTCETCLWLARNDAGEMFCWQTELRTGLDNGCGDYEYGKPIVARGVRA